MVAKIVDNVWEILKPYTLKDDYYIITDSNIYNLYKEEILDLISNSDNLIILKPGEQSKSLGELSNIYKSLIEKSISRNGVILSLGGGVVGDLSGFAASTFKRGIKYIQIPTTLLSQVDSSIGGKTGIDYLGFKNIIGSFYFPMETLVSPVFIKTLPNREITCGIGEIIKYGLISDYDLFKYTMDNLDKIYNRDMIVLMNIIEKSIKIKSSIIEIDRYDTGIRQKLNFGHTIGHSIESLYNYEKYNHGEAIILGIIFESKIAFQRGLINEDYYLEIISNLKPLMEIPKFNEDDINKLLEYMRNDKKNMDGKIRFVLPIAKGKVDIFQNIDDLTIRWALS